MAGRLVIALVVSSLPLTARAQGLVPLVAPPNAAQAEPIAGLGTTPLAELGGRVLFALDDGERGRELWATDLTPSGTALLVDIHPGPESSNPVSHGNPSSQTTEPVSQVPILIGGALLFAADDGVHGRELWRTDGTEAGTVLLRDIRPGAASSSLFDFTPGGTQTFFAASDPAHGSELWVSDGTAAGTHVAADVVPGPSGSGPDVHFESSAGLAYFSPYDETPDQRPVLAADASSATPAFLLEDTVADITPTNPSNFFEASSGLVFFRARASTQGQEPWVTDGTVAGTRFLGDVRPGPSGSSPTNWMEVNGTIVFGANSGTGGAGALWATDGTAGGTTKLKDVFPVFVGQAPGVTVFAGSSDSAGRELWTTDGSEAGTVMVRDINPGPESSGINRFFPYGNELLFVADDGVHGRQVWRTDGTDAGTAMLVDLSPARLPLRPLNDPRFMVLGSRIFFEVEGTRGREIWTSDGTAAGTRFLSSVHPSIEQSFIGSQGGTLLLASLGAKIGEPLWALDPSVPACPPAPAIGCMQAGQASLLVKENKPEGELWKVSLKQLQSPVGLADFGNPVTGTTRYDVCLYDEHDTLVSGLVVDRASGRCFSRTFRDCWRALGTAGFKYDDKNLGSYGVSSIRGKTGAVGKGSLSFAAKNSRSMQVALPRGIAAALAGDTSATLQVRTDDAACFSAALTTVSVATPSQFKAKRP